MQDVEADERFGFGDGEGIVELDSGRTHGGGEGDDEGGPEREDAPRVCGAPASQRVEC